MLSHRTDEVIFLHVTVQMPWEERILYMLLFQLHVEHIVFDIAFDCVLVKVFIVFLTAIPGVGHHLLALPVVTDFKGIQMVDERAAIAGPPRIQAGRRPATGPPA